MGHFPESRYPLIFQNMIKDNRQDFVEKSLHSNSSKEK